MSFTKSDLNWLRNRNARFVGGAFYFDIGIMHVKVCEWAGYGLPNEKFLCQIDVPNTSVYVECRNESMRGTVQEAVDAIVRQAKILEPLCEFNLKENKDEQN